MFKTTQFIVMAALCLNFTTQAQSQSRPALPKSHTITGKVISATTGEALPGAVIKITTTNQTVLSNDQGAFTLSLVNGAYNLSIYYLSHKTSNISIQVPVKEPLLIALETDDKNLQEVEIVSTGYQNIPKERATGSFTLIDNKTLNRAVSPDIMSRLKGVTNGLLFSDRNQAGNELGISVRGRSTIFSNTSPLVIVDNFPFEGDLNSLNPDMIESVTILKDAAAASIWGVRAGNGVIVITTKKGRLNQKPTISIKGDLTIGAKPDLYYRPQLTSSEYIDIEQFLFDKGAYKAIIDNGYEVISPVIEILQKIKLNPSYALQGIADINAFRNIDSRDQYSDYFMRNSAQQRYFTDLTGGGTNQSYYFSAGYDNNIASTVGQSDSRITLKASNTYSLFNNRININTDVSFSKSIVDKVTGVRGSIAYTPYEQIADVNGNALPTLTSGGLRASYTDNAGAGQLLDWKYRPLDELEHQYSRNNSELTDYRINVGLTYKITSPLKFSLNYQYYNANTKQKQSDDKDSFYTRDLINKYTQINSSTNAAIRPIPIGDIYGQIFESRQSNYGRAQLNFNNLYNNKHDFTAIAGFEIRADNYESSSYTVFGYNPQTATSIVIDPITQFPNFYSGALSRIGSSPSQARSNNRYVSLYGNASYTYDEKYVISGSYRKDASNLFGVKANQKIVPLWSAGVAWNIHKEKFFEIEALSSLQLKATYGYNGNINNSISAYLTASPSIYNQFNKIQSYSIINPPNENLRWERIKNLNFGLHFSTKNDRISGSVEYFVKNGMDLIATSPIAPQTGITLFTGNTADTHAKGVDIQINSKNINRQFSWSTTYIFNFVKDKITDYKVEAGTNGDIVFATGYSLAPLVGYPINSMFAFKWQGLNSTGNPTGYLDGSVSTDYTKIRNLSDPGQLDFHGSKTPTVFGSLRNTFSFKNLELSFNVTYKFGYYFRRNSLNNTGLYSSHINAYQPDYALRWQKAGDELTTTVPAPVYPANTVRNDFYASSSVLVTKGDHIRLQDIQLNYSLTKKALKKLPFTNLQFYAYANNLGILWRANQHHLDPEAGIYPAPKTLAIGFRTNF